MELRINRVRINRSRPVQYNNKKWGHNDCANCISRYFNKETGAGKWNHLFHFTLNDRCQENNAARLHTTTEFYLNEFHWIQQIKWIMTESRSGMATKSITHLATNTLPLLVIQSAFSLLSLGRFLMPLTTLNRYQPTDSSRKFFLSLHQGMYLLSDIEGQQVSHQRWIWGFCCMQIMKHACEEIHPGLETQADIIRSPKQGYQWLHKKDRCPPNFLKSIKVLRTKY